MEAFIRSTSAISPQQTFFEEGYLKEIVRHESEYLTSIEPDYKDYIDPKLSRRMARIIKMGVAAGMKSLRDAEVDNPDAIMIGTGLGCLKDTERFLTDIIENNEGVLSPTPFIQSTHNTIGGQIALMLGCNQYNFTYVHRGHSFESSLLDALFKLEEGASHVLVGGVDESTQTTYEILRGMNCVGKNDPEYVENPGCNRSPVLGEGSSFFVVSNRSHQAYAKISGIKTLYHPENIPEFVAEVREFLETKGVAPKNISVFLSGMNGVEGEDRWYRDVREELFPDKPLVRFKNLCGEYQTASAFGLNLAAHMVKNQKIYPSTLVEGTPGNTIDYLLLYSHYKQKNHNLMLLSRC